MAKKYVLLFPLSQKEEELQRNLENIKAADEGERKPENGAGKRKKGKKQPRIQQVLGHIPKKARSEKFCQLCKTHGVPHLTHNTSECHKCGKDGGAKGAAGEKGNPHKKGKELW